MKVRLSVSSVTERFKLKVSTVHGFCFISSAPFVTKYVLPPYWMLPGTKNLEKG